MVKRLTFWEVSYGKKKFQEKLSKLDEVKEKIVYYVYSPVRLFKAICFWVGFFVTSFSLALILGAFVFYMNLPGAEELQFDNLKKIAEEKIQKKSDYKFKWTKLRDLIRNFLYSFLLSYVVNYFSLVGISYDDLYNAFVANHLRNALMERPQFHSKWQKLVFIE